MVLAKRTKEEQQPAQQYDTTFKDWIRKVAPDVLPVFLPGAVYEDTLDIEIIKPAMRADKVFKIRFPDQDKEYIANVEFESGTDPHITSRLLVYNAVLYHDHQLPVISMIVYPFQTKMAESPLVVSDGTKNIITFDFQRLALFKEDAERYVREHIVSMYPLLPTMQGADHVLLKRAMDELADLYRGKEGTLAEQFIWMELLLERTGTISVREKKEIQKELKMYNSLWEDHPKVKALKAEIAESEAKGEIRGEIKAAQRMLVSVTTARFPALAELVQQEAAKMTNVGAIELLVQKVATAANEDIARWLLAPPTAS
jgi:hypothetical protein